MVRPHLTRWLMVYAAFPAAAIGLAAAVALAQVAPQASSSSQQSQAASAAAPQLQEVLVTATKEATAQDVSKVPISISAFTGEDLRAQGANSLAAIAAMTPGVNFSAQNNYGGAMQSNIEIRGIQSRTGSMTTALYYGDTPLLVSGNELNNSAAPALPLVFDMQRVEVLRGPQGTLFGDSAEGGAVRFIPQPASLTTPSSLVLASMSGTLYGTPSFETGVAEGAPLINGVLGFRASAYYRRDGGWIDRCEPAVQMPGCLFTLGTNVNQEESTALRFGMTWAPTDTLTITPNLYYQREHQDDGTGYEIADSNPSAGRFVFGLASPLPATDEEFIPSLRIEDDLGPVVLTSDTSYVWRHYESQVDYTEYQDWAFFGDPYPLTGQADDYARGDYTTMRNDLFEELRVASNSPNSRITWVAGLYGEDAHQFDHARVVHPDLPALIQQYYGVTIEQFLGVGPYLGQYVYFTDTPLTNKQVAIFANANIGLTRTLKLNVGARESHFDTKTTLFLAGPFNGGTTTFAGGASSNAFTPKVGFSWEPTSTSLYYVSAGKGYRAPLLNAQTTSLIPSCHVTAPTEVKSDSLWSYEIGAKDFFFNRRLSVSPSVYYIKWSDIQNAIDVPQCGIEVTLNVGTVISKGFDLSAKALVTDNLQLGVGVSYTDSYYADTVILPFGGIGQIVAAGERVAGASDVTGAAVPPWAINFEGEYELPRNFYFSLQDIYHSRNNGPFFTQNPANVIEYDPNLPTDPSTNMLKLRFGWRGARLDVKLFVDNALNSHPQLSVNHAQPDDPRLSAVTFRPLTVGITATYQ